MAQKSHVLVITFPSQGNTNPGLHFAKLLIKKGIQVSFATTVYAHRRMAKAGTAPRGLHVVSFSDGYDEGYQLKPEDGNQYFAELEKRGREGVRDIIVGFAEQGRPVTRLVYSILITWAVDVARDFHIPSAFLWVQPAAVFDIYYYYFHGYEDKFRDNSKSPNWSLDLPGLPSLSERDLPSFLVSKMEDLYSFAMTAFKEHLQKLGEEEDSRILVNTFDALEPEALKALETCRLIGVGPLIPSAFLDGEDPTDTSSGFDLFETSEGYKEWLNSKEESSVVYVSFGSLINLPKAQMEEIARGLLDTGRPFLWVIRENENLQKGLSCMEELEQQGMIVPWCSQLEVLTHPSVGCFVTHCGWNSTLESLSCGVPMVAFPQWTDQATNAKMIEDVWKAGVRVTSSEEDGRVESGEIKKSIEMVMGEGGGERGEEMRRNAKRWRDLAREAMREGGSSHKNLMSFVEEVGKNNN